MAYVKTGATAGLTKKTKKKILVGSILGAMVLLFIILWLACPRVLVKTVTSDAGYTNYVVAKNARSLANLYKEYPAVFSEDKAYQIDGSIGAELTPYGANELGGSQAELKFKDYLSRTKVRYQWNRNSGNKETQFSMQDPDGPVITVDKKTVAGSSYENIEELSTGWMLVEEKTKSKTKNRLQQIWDSADSKVKKRILHALSTGFKEVMGDISYTVEGGQTLTIDQKSVTATRCNILLGAAQGEEFVTAVCASLAADADTFQAINATLKPTQQLSGMDYSNLVKTLRELGLALIKESGVDKMSVDLFVNAKNEIVGMQFMSKSNKGDIFFSCIFQAEEDHGMAAFLRVGKQELLRLNQVPKDKKNGVVTLSFGNVSGAVQYRDIVLKKGSVSGELIAQNITLKGAEEFGPLAGSIKLDDTDAGGAKLTAGITSESLGTLYFQGTVSDGIGGAIGAPEKADITAYNKDAVTKQTVQYFLQDLPKKSNSYNNMYKNIINGLYQNLLTKALLSGNGATQA